MIFRNRMLVLKCTASTRYFFKCGRRWINFVTWTEMLKHWSLLERTSRSNGVEMSRKRDISKRMKSKKFSPEPDDDVRQQSGRDDLCCQFALLASALWRTDFALWVTLTCVVLGSLPNRSHGKILCPIDGSYTLAVVFPKALSTVILNLWELCPNVTQNKMCPVFTKTFKEVVLFPSSVCLLDWSPYRFWTIR